MIIDKKYKGRYVVLFNGEVIDSDTNLESIIKRVPISGMLVYVPDDTQTIGHFETLAYEKIQPENKCFLCEIFNPKINLQTSQYVNSEVDAEMLAIDKAKQGMEVEVWELKFKVVPKHQSDDS